LRLCFRSQNPRFSTSIKYEKREKTFGANTFVRTQDDRIPKRLLSYERRLEDYFENGRGSRAYLMQLLMMMITGGMELKFDTLLTLPLYSGE
jgi:hypothetical protein